MDRLHFWLISFNYSTLKIPESNTTGIHLKAFQKLAIANGNEYLKKYTDAFKISVTEHLVYQKRTSPCLLNKQIVDCPLHRKLAFF